MRTDSEIAAYIEAMKTREMPTWVQGSRLNHDAVRDDLLDFTKWLLEIE
ncbi:MAG: hypothetical protein HXS47_08060 [Theionarchaea archaeon]|nr:hypothetical protein [Theionarchaea archaeon]